MAVKTALDMSTVTLREGNLSDRWLQADRLIQVVQNKGQNTVKMPFYITVNDVVYSLCISELKNHLLAMG